MELPESINHFIEEGILPIKDNLNLLPYIIVYTILSALFVGWLKKRTIKTAYTRKIFHVLIFGFAAFMQAWYGLSAVLLLGISASMAVVFALYRGDGFYFYEAMARPSDAPRRSLFIIIPLITTAFGGILSNLFFYPFAVVGYLVGGLGDAVGEPVGARWGKHWYKVPSLAGVKAQRSLEGSSAVFLMSFVGSVIALQLYGADETSIFLTGLLCALASTLVEAFSSHGLDNLTIQLAASATAWVLL